MYLYELYSFFFQSCSANAGIVCRDSFHATGSCHTSSDGGIHWNQPFQSPSKWITSYDFLYITYFILRKWPWNNKIFSESYRGTYKKLIWRYIGDRAESRPPRSGGGHPFWGGGPFSL